MALLDSVPILDSIPVLASVPVLEVPVLEVPVRDVPVLVEVPVSDFLPVLPSVPLLASVPVLDVLVLVAVPGLDFIPLLDSIPDAEIKFKLGKDEMWTVSIGLVDVGVSTPVFSPSTGEEATLVDLDCERLILGTDAVVKNAVLPVPKEVILYCESRPDISSLSKLLELEVPMGVEVIESELVVEADTLSSMID